VRSLQRTVWRIRIEEARRVRGARGKHGIRPAAQRLQTPPNAPGPLTFFRAMATHQVVACVLATPVAAEGFPDARRLSTRLSPHDVADSMHPVPDPLSRQVAYRGGVRQKSMSDVVCEPAV